MLYIEVTREAGKISSAIVLTEEQVKTMHEARLYLNKESRWDWRTFEAAKEVAAALGPDYIATDSGPCVSPRYDVIKLPKVGDKVSYAFNGDYYPCGEIVSVSDSKKLIVTSEGQKFYRRGQSGVWKYKQTWSLVQGHISRLNPEF